MRGVTANGQITLGDAFAPIERPRLLERFLTAAHYRITSVIAPAGYGKSVAMRQYLLTLPSFLLYEVASDATTLAPFARGLVTALCNVVPDLEAAFASASPAGDRQCTAGELAAWLAPRLRDLDTTIAIDDLHIGDDDPEITHFVTALLDDARIRARWVLSSRTAGALPYITWLAYGAMDLTIDAYDLGFTFEEARAMANASHIGVSDEELRAILDLVEGWPTALTFALRTRTRVNDLRTVAATTRELVYRYLAEQVYDGLDIELQRLLRFAAFLPRLELPLAVAGGFNDAAKLIASLRERVAFVMPIDVQTFRLHDLFRDFVLRQIELDGADRAETERHAVAQILEENGRFGDTLELYLEASANAEADIERILERANFELITGGHIDKVERALKRLSKNRLVENVYILGLRAAVEAYHSRTAQARAWYQLVIERSSDPRFRRAVIFRLANLELEASKTDTLTIESLLREDDLDTIERCEGYGYLAVAYAIRASLDEARTAIEQALALADLTPDDVRSRTYARACEIATLGRDDATAIRFGKKAVDVALAAGFPAIAGRAYALLARNALWTQRRAEALYFAEQAASYAARGSDHDTLQRALAFALRIAAESGNDDRVAAIEAEIQRHTGSGATPPLWHRAYGLALAAAGEGDFESAHEHCSRIPEDDMVPSRRLLRAACLALFFAAGNRRGDALRMLVAYDTALAREDINAPLNSYDDLHLAQRAVVLTHIALGRRTSAMRVLRALDDPDDAFRAYDQALAAMLTENPNAFREACSRLGTFHFGGYARLCTRVGNREAGERVPQPASLTRAELLVLAAIADGCSNKTIAEAQGRTINTIRTHVSSILRKLGARSRGEAVAIARRQKSITESGAVP
jgi:ATP/maltotriose-dependent transcriptional regulator MalT